MKSFLFLLTMICLTACQGMQNRAGESPASLPRIDAVVTYAVSQTITVVNEGPQTAEKHHIWIALIGDQPPYQQLLSRQIQPENHIIFSDEYGNQFAEFDLKELAPGESTQLTIHYEIAVNELSYSLSTCSGDSPEGYDQAEQHIESNNPQIISLAKTLAAPNQTVCQQTRSFYDYVGDNLIYSYNGDNWGAQAALGKMGADCTEYSSLLIALSRASGIPARYVEGLLYLDQTNSTQARQEHAWVEIYLPGNGWIPVDPTLGRSPLTREENFGRYSANHIIVTNGRTPSTLRGASYWSHLYWPGDSTTIRIQDAHWTIQPRSFAPNP